MVRRAAQAGYMAIASDWRTRFCEEATRTSDKIDPADVMIDTVSYLDDTGRLKDNRTLLAA